MKKAQILQFSILFLILLISYFTYNYLNTDKNYNNAKTKEKTDNVRIVEKQELKNSNVINHETVDPNLHLIYSNDFLHGNDGWKC